MESPQRESPAEFARRLRRGAWQALFAAKLAGLDCLPIAVQVARAQTAGTGPCRMPQTSGGEQPHAASPSANEPVDALRVLANEVCHCTQCPELVTNRRQTVFGVGDPQARLCFVGEAPGADEDRLGEPFVGRAGQLLDRILAACTLQRDDVYILNVLKCRPPNNRTPAVEEVEHCRGFFEQQLEIIQPEFICCLGSVAASSLLRTKAPLSRLRGSLHDWRGISVAVTYHPAYLLRNPSAKAETWKDLQMLMQAMGIAIPHRGR